MKPDRRDFLTLCGVGAATLTGMGASVGTSDKFAVAICGRRRFECDFVIASCDGLDTKKIVESLEIQRRREEPTGISLCREGIPYPLNPPASKPRYLSAPNGELSLQIVDGMSNGYACIRSHVVLTRWGVEVQEVKFEPDGWRAVRRRLNLFSSFFRLDYANFYTMIGSRLRPIRRFCLYDV